MHILYRGEILNAKGDFNHGRWPWRAVLAPESAKHAQAVSVPDRRWKDNDPADGRANSAAGGYGGHFHRHQPQLQGAGALPATGAAGGEHPLRAGGQEHRAMHWAGSRAYGEAVRGRGDDGAALGPPH